jgi:uncharacterized protein YfbU (UPF0304 family)
MTFSERVQAEVAQAREQHREIHSVHEGYSVILEELEEFWDEVRKKPAQRDLAILYMELVQVAATAQRTAEDVLGHPSFVES